MKNRIEAVRKFAALNPVASMVVVYVLCQLVQLVGVCVTWRRWSVGKGVEQFLYGDFRWLDNGNLPVIYTALFSVAVVLAHRELYKNKGIK